MSVTMEARSNGTMKTTLRITLAFEPENYLNITDTHDVSDLLIGLSTDH